MSEFFHMGGYGLYIWPSYALSAVFLLLNVYLARSGLARARLQAKQKIKALEARNAPEA